MRAPKSTPSTTRTLRPLGELAASRKAAFAVLSSAKTWSGLGLGLGFGLGLGLGFGVGVGPGLGLGLGFGLGFEWDRVWARVTSSTSLGPLAAALAF